MVGIPTEYFHIVLMISQIGKVNPHPWNNQQKCALLLITSICCHIVIFATDNEFHLEFTRHSYEQFLVDKPYQQVLWDYFYMEK